MDGVALDDGGLGQGRRTVGDAFAAPGAVKSGLVVGGEEVAARAFDRLGTVLVDGVEWREHPRFFGGVVARVERSVHPRFCAGGDGTREIGAG